MQKYPLGIRRFCSAPKIEGKMNYPLEAEVLQKSACLPGGKGKTAILKINKTIFSSENKK